MAKNVYIPVARFYEGNAPRLGGDLNLTDFVVNTAAGDDLVSRDYANNADAIEGGVPEGELYHTAGAVKVVIPA